MEAVVRAAEIIQGSVHPGHRLTVLAGCLLRLGFVGDFRAWGFRKNSHIAGPLGCRDGAVEISILVRDGFGCRESFLSQVVQGIQFNLNVF